MEEPVENVVTEVPEEVFVVKPVEEVIKLSLIQLLDNIINNKQDKDNDEIILSPNLQKYILLIIKENPKIFMDVEVSMENIIKDGKIDIKDIPDLLVIISKLYEILHHFKDNFKNENMYEFVKTLLNIVFMVYMDEHDVENKTLFQNMQTLVSSAIDLIKLQQTLKKSKSCFF
jgi:hypothetical protein